MKLQLEFSRDVITTADSVGAGGFGEARLHGSNAAFVVKTAIRKDQPLPYDKLCYMISHPLVPSDRGHRYCWPLDICVDPATGERCGYVMEKAEGAVDFERALAAGPPDRYRLRVAHNLCRSLVDLHRVKIFRSDWPNFMVLIDATVVEIDLDSVQIARPDGQFRSGCVKLSTIPPRLITLQRTGGGEFDTTEEDDLWSLAVVLWMWLRDGESPFACRWTGPGRRPSDLQRIEQGLWPHSGKHPEVEPRRGATPFASLDRELQFLFTKAFEDGHARPEWRPTAADWAAAFARLDRRGDVTLSHDEWRAVQTGRPARRRPPLRVTPPRRSRVAAGALAVGVLAGGYALHLPGQQTTQQDVAGPTFGQPDTTPRTSADVGRSAAIALSNRPSPRDRSAPSLLSLGHLPAKEPGDTPSLWNATRRPAH